MVHYMDDAELVWPGLSIICQLNLAGNKFARDAILKEENISIMLEGIKRHSGHEKVQEFGAKVIEMISHVKEAIDSHSDLNTERTGDCCLRCLKLSLQQESPERWNGCTCNK